MQRQPTVANGRLREAQSLKCAVSTMLRMLHKGQTPAFAGISHKVVLPTAISPLMAFSINCDHSEPA